MATEPTAEELAKPVSVQNLKDVQEANEAQFMAAESYQSLRNNMGLGNTLGALPVENGGTGTTSIEGVKNVTKRFVFGKRDQQTGTGYIQMTVPRGNYFVFAYFWGISNSEEHLTVYINGSIKIRLNLTGTYTSDGWGFAFISLSEDTTFGTNTSGNAIQLSPYYAAVMFYCVD